MSMIELFDECSAYICQLAAMQCVRGEMASLRANKPFTRASASIRRAPVVCRASNSNKNTTESKPVEKQDVGRRCVAVNQTDAQPGTQTVLNLTDRKRGEDRIRTTRIVDALA
jgi:hypothetical protein